MGSRPHRFRALSLSLQVSRSLILNLSPRFVRQWQVKKSALSQCLYVPLLLSLSPNLALFLCRLNLALSLWQWKAEAARGFTETLESVQTEMVADLRQLEASLEACKAAVEGGQQVTLTPPLLPPPPSSQKYDSLVILL